MWEFLKPNRDRDVSLLRFLFAFALGMAALAGVLYAINAHAEEWRPPALDFEQFVPRTWVCDFPSISVPVIFSLRGGRGTVTASGSAPVEVHYDTFGYGVTHIVEWTPSGTPMVTTIMPDGRAVHSRHTVMLFDKTPIWSQTEGNCRRVD